MNIIELAKEAGLALTDHGHPEGYAVFCERLEAFAAIVRAEERKRTVEILMELHRKANGQHNYYHYAANEIMGFNVTAEREWVDLTDDEIEEIGKSYFDEWSFGFARAVIAADREKNK